MGRWGVVVVVVVVLAALGCSGGGGGGTPTTATTEATDATNGPATEVVVTLGADEVRADEVIAVRVEGLAADGEATLAVRATDDRGRRWEGEAPIRADGDGVVALDVGATAEADPASPDGAATALLSTLDPVDGEPEPFFWSLDGVPFTVEVRAEGGATGTAEVVRHLVGGGVTSRATDRARDGFTGVLWSPAAAATATTRPAVLLIGGSGGGYGGLMEAPLLASHGIPALQIALFGEPGLPERLFEIPLEDVTTALRWLAAQPGVDPDRVWVLGASRGSEAALLVGALFPELVAGVVAAAPSSVVNCAFPGCDGPAWTLGGEPVPHTFQFRSTAPTDDPGAVIPVERIDGPVHTTCGVQDDEWPACAYVDAIVERRAEAGAEAPADARAGDATARSLEAGHGVAIVAPQAYLDPALGDAERRADDAVRAEAWTDLLAALGA